MKTYSYSCDDPKHGAMEFSVEANGDDEALEMMRAKVKSHLGEHHSDMMQTDKELDSMITSGWSNM